MKTLYANGCSWTAGNGIENDPVLQDRPVHERWAAHKDYNWAKILANKLEMNCINQSQGAGSNKRMVRTTCEFLQGLPEEEYKNLFVALSWSTVDRSEVYLQEEEKGQWCIFNATQPISSHCPPFSKSFLKNADSFQREYIVSAYNYRSNYFSFFQEMYLMSNLLENLGIPYVFFSSLPWRRLAWTYPYGLDIEKEFDLQISKLRKPQILNTRDCDDVNNVMAEFCKIHSLPMAPDHHTMIDGHRAWAEHLYTEIQKLNYENLQKL
jgi:hypothetical protein